MTKKEYIQLAIALLTVTVDIFHLGLVYPIFSEIALGMGEEESWQRAIIYAIFIVAYPFGQFIGSPYFGRLSDKYGRKKLLIVSVAGSGVGMSICALGVFYYIPSVIFFGRLLGGFMGANMSLAYAAIVDLSNSTNKVRNLSLIPLCASIGFAAGPLFVGLSMDANSSLLEQTLPLWFAVMLSGVNWVFLWFFEETSTHHPKEISKSNEKKSELLLKDRELWPAIASVFLMVTANFLLLQYIGPFSVVTMDADLVNISWLYVNAGLSCIFGHLFFTRNLASIASPRMLLPWALAFFACSLIAIAFSHTLFMLHVTLSITMISCAVAYTNVFAYLSDYAGPNRQGEAMGLGVSAQCLAEWLPPLILGAFVVRFPALPMLCGALTCFLGIIIVKRNRKLKDLSFQ